jgi:antitoxin component HigA of HigAB toxin-antitoxin module
MSAANKLTYYTKLVNVYPLLPIKTETQHTSCITMLEKLMDDFEECHNKEEKSQVKDYITSLKILIKDYESKIKRHPADFKAVDVLKFLMEQNNLTQEDFENELGTQSTVSKILNGNQDLKVVHVERLAKRFKVYLAAFFSSI